jgi:putative membrane protein insertion efficiency factor
VAKKLAKRAVQRNLVKRIGRDVFRHARQARLRSGVTIVGQARQRDQAHDARRHDRLLGRLPEEMRRESRAGPVALYRYAISPMLGRNCRFVPSCSEYAVEAVERHGALKGGWLAARRVCRCHPFSGGGYDPVP